MSYDPPPTRKSCSGAQVVSRRLRPSAIVAPSSARSGCQICKPAIFMCRLDPDINQWSMSWDESWTVDETSHQALGPWDPGVDAVPPWVSRNLRMANTQQAQPSISHALIRAPHVAREARRQAVSISVRSCKAWALEKRVGF